MDRHLRFVFLTGVSKFSRVGVFSGLNNIEDLSLRPSAATLLGLTESEIQTYLADQICDFAAQEKISQQNLIQQMRHWYNGFCFAGGAENVYNPFSTLLLFKEKRFTNHWFETGTPTFLIKLINHFLVR